MLTPVEIKIREYFLFCEWSGSEAAVQHLRFSPETSSPAVQLFYTWNYPTGTSPWFLQTKLQFSSRVPQKVLGPWESSCGGSTLGTGFLVFVISYNTNFSLCKEPPGCLEKFRKFCRWLCNRKFSFLSSAVATDFLFCLLQEKNYVNTMAFMFSSVSPKYVEIHSNQSLPKLTCCALKGPIWC